ncbi:MAG: hypothetical protein WKF73_09580 [Nocardioidaceae bacterium]
MRLRTEYTVSRHRHTYATLPTPLEIDLGEGMSATILEFNEHMWHMSVTEPVEVKGSSSSPILDGSANSPTAADSHCQLLTCRATVRPDGS